MILKVNTATGTVQAVAAVQRVFPSDSWASCFSRFQAAIRRLSLTLNCAKITAWNGDRPGEHAHEFFLAQNVDFFIC